MNDAAKQGTGGRAGSRVDVWKVAEVEARVLSFGRKGLMRMGLRSGRGMPGWMPGGAPLGPGGDHLQAGFADALFSNFLEKVSEVVLRRTVAEEDVILQGESSG